MQEIQSPFKARGIKGRISRIPFASQCLKLKMKIMKIDNFVWEEEEDQAQERKREPTEEVNFKASGKR